MVQDQYDKALILTVESSNRADTLSVVNSDDATRLDTSVWVIPTRPLSDNLGYRVVKRVADVIIAATALLLLSPVFAIVSFLIWLEDRGPAFFTQPRVGRFGVPIKFYKFRSMRLDAEELHEEFLSQSDAMGVAFKMKNDPRVTKIGKFIRKTSIDELPQLITVLIGDMSIIGPRPLAMREGYLCGDQYAVRYMVKPGLLCYREVRGRSKLSFDEWMSFDREYVQNRSIWVDLKIFLMLFPALLKADGAY